MTGSSAAYSYMHSRPPNHWIQVFGSDSGTLEYRRATKEVAWQDYDLRNKRRALRLVM